MPKPGHGRIELVKIQALVADLPADSLNNVAVVADLSADDFKNMAVVAEWHTRQSQKLMSA